MKRRHRLLRDKVQRRYERLYQFFAGYFHQDFVLVHGGVDEALAAAIADHPVEARQEVRRELQALMAEYPDPAGLADVLWAGLGVNFYSSERGWARSFVEQADRELLASIKAHFEQPAPPGPGV
jgi:AcrR family transcriptional regulator